MHSLDNVPSQVNTLDVPEVEGPVPNDVGRFWSVLYAPKTHLVSWFRSWYRALFKECNRMKRPCREVGTGWGGVGDAAVQRVHRTEGSVTTFHTVCS